MSNYETSRQFKINNDISTNLIPKFEPNDLHEINKDDATLLQLMGWLCTPEVLNCTDYRTLDKSKIFNISVEEYATRINKIT